MKREDINFEEYLVYDETSPSCLRWVVDRVSGRSYVKTVSAGDPAGCLSKDTGYWEVCLYGMLFKGHRVVYELHFGSIGEGLCVDHVHGARSDNRIAGLRAVSTEDNSRNMRMFSNNTSGRTGIAFHSKGRKGAKELLYAVAQWSDGPGKHRSKVFSVNKFGLLPAFAMACCHREAALLALEHLGIVYSERHGK